jgi:hypothetical protein
LLLFSRRERARRTARAERLQRVAMASLAVA